MCLVGLGNRENLSQFRQVYITYTFPGTFISLGWCYLIRLNFAIQFSKHLYISNTCPGLTLLLLFAAALRYNAIFKGNAIFKLLSGNAIFKLRQRIFVRRLRRDPRDWTYRPHLHVGSTFFQLVSRRDTQRISYLYILSAICFSFPLSPDPRRPWRLYASPPAPHEQPLYNGSSSSFVSPSISLSPSPFTASLSLFVMVYHACVYVYRYVINDAERGLN